VHVSLLCLVLHLLAAAPVRHWSRTRLLLAPLAIAAWLVGPLQIADLLAGNAQLHVRGDHAVSKAWVNVAGLAFDERTYATQLFVWGVYTSAWLLPVVITVWPLRSQ
jgi:hypothetical protein